MWVRANDDINMNTLHQLFDVGEQLNTHHVDIFVWPVHEHDDYVNLLLKVKFDELKLNIEGRTPNWESDRIAQIDYVILITAIAELIYFSSIPTKVTINEYIDIAKEFSTPASGKFVNGVLDNIVKDLIEQGLIVKTGRGLIT